MEHIDTDYPWPHPDLILGDAFPSRDRRVVLGSMFSDCLGIRSDSNPHFLNAKNLTSLNTRVWILQCWGRLLAEWYVFFWVTGRIRCWIWAISSPQIELRKSLQSIWKHHGDIQHPRKSVLISEFSAAVRVLLRVLHPFFMSWACHKIRKPQSHHFPINILQV